MAFIPALSEASTPLNSPTSYATWSEFCLELKPNILLPTKRESLHPQEQGILALIHLLTEHKNHLTHLKSRQSLRSSDTRGFQLPPFICYPAAWFTFQLPPDIN